MKKKSINESISSLMDKIALAKSRGDSKQVALLNKVLERLQREKQKKRT